VRRARRIAAGLAAAARAALLPACERAVAPDGQGAAPGSPLDAAGIVERAGARIPDGLVFQDQRGERFDVDDALGGPPVLLTLAWYHCRMLCGRVLDDTARAVRDAGLDPGRDVRLLTVSIDPRDDAGSAARRLDEVSGTFGRPLPPEAWRFLWGDAEAAARLADRVGFRFRYDSGTDQYAHPAALFVLAPDGRLASRLDGVEFPGASLRQALDSAARGEVHGDTQPLLLRCFEYVPALRRHADAIATFFRIGGLIAPLGYAVFIVRSVRARRPLRESAP
jgi:protein SCO1/2